MARETDFIDLYKDLGLHPGCGLPELKLAYRRRLAALHPDRHLDEAWEEHADARLKRLIVLYNTALAFHRQHGRLPGAARARQPHTAARHRPSPQPRSTQRHSRQLLALFGVAVATWLFWGSEPPKSPKATVATDTSIQNPDPGEKDTPAQALSLGLTKDSVRKIEGDPLIIAGDLWEYGPSWIRFRDGSVVDWYSSALRPLKLAPERTTPENWLHDS